MAATLERYTSALQQRDLAALKAVWPSLGGAQQAAIEGDFNNARSISVQFVNPKIEVSGSTATITGIRRYGMQTRDGQQLRNEATHDAGPAPGRQRLAHRVGAFSGALTPIAFAREEP